MTTHAPAKVARWVLLVAPIVIVPLSFFAMVPWLKQQSEAISLGIAAAFAIFVMGYSVLLAALVDRRLDEVEMAGQRFAQAKGLTIGSFAAVVVMMVPPAMDALSNLASSIGAGSPDKAIRVGIAIGFMMVVLLQLFGMVAGAIWWRRRLLGGRAST